MVLLSDLISVDNDDETSWNHQCSCSWCSVPTSTNASSLAAACDRSRRSSLAPCWLSRHEELRRSSGGCAAVDLLLYLSVGVSKPCGRGTPSRGVVRSVAHFPVDTPTATIKLAIPANGMADGAERADSDSVQRRADRHPRPGLIPCSDQPGYNGCMLHYHGFPAYFLIRDVGRTMARFFISHSAVEGSRTEAILNAVQEGLEGRNHQVFVDSLIRPGERWRARLYDELARCDVGIVLLDEEALKPNSWWIRREVYNLLWRQHLGSVHIRGILLDGITPSTVRHHGYGELVDLQLILTSEEGADSVAVARNAIEDFDVVQCNESDSMRRWINEIVDIIRKVEAGKTLDGFAEAVGVDKDELSKLFPPDCYRFLAHQLLGRPTPLSIFTAVTTIEHLIGKDGTAALARRAVPALVDGEAAWSLLRCENTKQEKSRPVFVLNAESTTTSELYVLRASCCARTYRHAGVSTSMIGEDFIGDLEWLCEEAMAEMLHIRGNPHSEQVRRKIANYCPGQGKLVEAGFLAIEARVYQMANVAEVIRKLRKQHPWLAVIVLIGPTVPEMTKEWEVGDVSVLEPLLSDGEENELDEVLLAFKDVIDKEVLFRG